MERPRTAYKRIGSHKFDHKAARAQLQSASGKRPKDVAPLLDEEDMIDEREIRRATNRLKRRDYEHLAQDDEYQQMFKDPLDRYDEVIDEAPSQLEDDGTSMEDTSNVEGRGLLRSAREQMEHSQQNLMPIEEDKVENSDMSNQDEDGIKFINQQDTMNRLDSQVSGTSSQVRSKLLDELKRSKGKINRVLSRKEKQILKDITQYDKKFTKDADEDIMEVGRVDLEDLETDFGMIEEERDRKKKQRELEFEHRRKGIELTSATTQNKLVNAHTDLLKEIAQEEVDARKKAVEREKIIDKEFVRIEDRVGGVIKEQRSKILSYFGPLVQEKKRSAYTILGSAKKKVDLSARTKICLPFSVKVKMLRCVKDKIGAGVYVVLAEIIERIGGGSVMYNYQKSMKNLHKLKGKILEYEKLKLRFLKEQNIDVSTQESEGIMAALEEAEEELHEDEQREQRSAPASRSSQRSKQQAPEIDEEKFEKLTFKQRHTRYRNFYAGFDDEEFYLDENLYLLYPPMNRARPSNCIQFRLVKLSDEKDIEDEVVAWGVFPLLNSELAFNEGRFKIPLLFGDVDEEVTLYRNIQGRVMKNLDTWLCNMYFEVEPLLIQKLIFDWQNREMYYDKEQLNKIHGYVLKREEDPDQNMAQPNAVRESFGGQSARSSRLKRKRSTVRNATNLISNLHDADLDRQNSNVRLSKDQTRELDQMIGYEAEEFKKEQQREIKAELDDNALFLEEYSYSVSDKFNNETRNVAKKKMVYLFTESLADMGLKNMNTIAFQITLFVIVLSFWARVYIHYFGEYLALLIIGIKVSKFNPEWYKVELHYESWESWHEAIIIILGVLLNTFFFSLMIISAYFVNKYTQFPHIFYKMMCWFGIATTIDFLLILAVDCIEQNWTRGDMFKLYQYYNRRDANGYPGLAITIFIYVVLTFINLSLMYYYLIFIHMGGRVIDIYLRLSGNVNHFFLPHDDEISLTYLKWVCKKAFKSQKQRVTTRDEEVVNERGKRKKVRFINVFKFDPETHELCNYRSFIRDYDGAIREFHTKKVPLKKEELKGITEDIPPEKGTETYNHNEFFPEREESSEGEGGDGVNGSDEEEKTPFSRRNVDSHMELRDRSNQSRSFNDNSRMSDEDRKIDNSLHDEEEDDESNIKHL